MKLESDKKRKTIKSTFCIFIEVPLSSIANKTIDYKSDSGSEYFYTDEGVFRLANHWGKAATSKWRLIPNPNNEAKLKLGFALWTDFHKDNLNEKLYFLEVDFENKLVYFNHKNNLKPNHKAVLRTASETTIVIRQIRKLFDSTTWTKHFEIQNITEKVINQLIVTNEPLQNIKAKFL